MRKFSHRSSFLDVWSLHFCKGSWRFQPLQSLSVIITGSVDQDDSPMQIFHLNLRCVVRPFSIQCPWHHQSAVYPQDAGNVL